MRGRIKPIAHASVESSELLESHELVMSSKIVEPSVRQTENQGRMKVRSGVRFCTPVDLWSRVSV